MSKRKTEHDAIFAPENARVECRKERLSPGGTYKLVVTPYATGPGHWAYTQGLVYRVGSDTPIAEIRRNYSAFPALFVEVHPNGHDYLVCGEDYQGQTVIELDTGKRRDELSEGTDKGHGFCWAEARFHPTSVLAVAGCHWACPYEYRFFDFADPMSGWPEIETEGGVEADAAWPTFGPDGTIRVYQTNGESGDAADAEPGEPVAPRVDRAMTTLRREGRKLVVVSEWVSPEEQAERAARAAARKQFEEAFAAFKASDPLYLAHAELVKDPAFHPEDHASLGFTYEAQGWPAGTVQEGTYCRRIFTSKARNVDIAWGRKTGPIKVEVYRDGKKAETRLFEHSVAGMHEAFSYAKGALRG
jgi:hypothetical protein